MEIESINLYLEWNSNVDFKGLMKLSNSLLHHLVKLMSCRFLKESQGKQQKEP